MHDEIQLCQKLHVIPLTEIQDLLLFQSNFVFLIMIYLGTVTSQKVESFVT